VEGQSGLSKGSSGSESGGQSVRILFPAPQQANTIIKVV
jgi:hypothetical protein